jgi:hypothetical protein
MKHFKNNNQSKKENNGLAQKSDAYIKQQSQIIVSELCALAFRKLRQN